jgi:hypothetical protein
MSAPTDQTSRSIELETRALTMQREEHWRAWDDRNRRIIRDIERQRAADARWQAVEYQPWRRLLLWLKEALT